MSEILMLTAPEPVQKAVKAITDYAKRDLETSIKRTQSIYNAWVRLKEAGVIGVPEQITDTQCRWGFVVEVEDAKEWGKIHKALGKLQLTSKTAVDTSEYNEDGTKKRGRKVQMIKLKLSPEAEYLAYNVEFTVKRKLTKNDKCQVKVVTSKRTEVVCSLK